MRMGREWMQGACLAPEASSCAAIAGCKAVRGGARGLCSVELASVEVALADVVAVGGRVARGTSVHRQLGAADSVAMREGTVLRRTAREHSPRAQRATLHAACVVVYSVVTQRHTGGSR